MKITKKQLQSLIREEYLRSTPRTRRGHMMNEVRANMLAQQTINEGFFDVLKGFVKGAGKSGGEVAAAVGDKANAKMTAAANAMGKFMQTAEKTAADYKDAIAAFADEKLKGVMDNIKDAIKEEIKASLVKSVKKGIQDLVKAGMDEKDAKEFVVQATTAGTAQATAEVASGGGG